MHNRTTIVTKVNYIRGHRYKLTSNTLRRSREVIAHLELVEPTENVFAVSLALRVYINIAVAVYLLKWLLG